MNAHVSLQDLTETDGAVPPPVPALNELLSRQRSAFLRDGPPSAKSRKADLKKLKAEIRANLPELEQAIHADFEGRPSNETAILECVGLIQGINYLHRHLGAWMRPQRRHVAMQFRPGSAQVMYQPVGVVGIMSPWNFPVGLSLMPLATALAAGNRAMLKPSEITPRASELLRRMLAGIFPEDQVAVVTGGPDVGAAFSSLPFDHLVFTGSTPVGKVVMRAASDNLVPVTLELGGKSPVVIEKGFPLDRVAASLAFGKLANGGQVCVAPDYALVPEGEIDAFVAAYDKAIRARYPQGAADDNYTAIVNERHYERLHELLNDARSKGARVIELGAAPESALTRAHTIAPTVVLGATRDMDILNEEIFGPVLPVLPYRDIDDAIGYINEGSRPLALYYFGQKGADRTKLLTRTTSGGVTINDTLMHYVQDDLPFGGSGGSGMGAYHGIEGFRALSHAKSVFRQSRWNLADITRPPYGPLTRLVTWYLMR